MSEPFTTYTSLVLDDLLDKFGFSETDIRERQICSEKATVARTLSARSIQKRDDIDRILVGSQREGVGLLLVSDCDILQIYKSLYCIEDENDIQDSKLCFHLDGKLTAAGHFFLRLLNKDTEIKAFQEFQHALIEKDGELYLSSEFFMKRNDDMFADGQGWISTHTCYMDRKGPSIPKYVKHDRLQEAFLKPFLQTLHQDFLVNTIDYVRGIPCYVPCIVQAWQTRKRHCNWPSMQTIKKVTSLPAFVVPVGEKKTKNKDLQWRICFTLGELCLVKSLNNTHMKVYGALKFISKHILNPNSAGCQITSFMVKNVVFWQAEMKPREMFMPDLLWHRIEDALQFIKKCVTEKNLPYYMLPERNLLKNRVTKHQQKCLLEKIDHLLQNGQCMFLTMVEDIDNDSAKSEVLRAWETMEFANEVSQISTLAQSNFTLDQFVAYMETEYHRKSIWMKHMYNIFTVNLPAMELYEGQVLGLIEEKVTSQLAVREIEKWKREYDIEFSQQCSEEKELEPRKPKKDQDNEVITLKQENVQETNWTKQTKKSGKSKKKVANKKKMKHSKAEHLNKKETRRPKEPKKKPCNREVPIECRSNEKILCIPIKEWAPRLFESFLQNLILSFVLFAHFMLIPNNERNAVITVDTNNPHVFWLGILVAYVIVTILKWLFGKAPRQATLVLKKKENTHKIYGKIVETIN